MPANANDMDFQIGLTMSGAISAGAYTAGVFDFLIQALDEWENARDHGDIPDHHVRLKVMSGASAGAITAAIGTISLASGDEPILFASPKPDKQKIKCYLPKLYDTWVVKPGLVAEGREPNDFLTLTDLEGPPAAEDDFSRTTGVPPEPKDLTSRPVASLLNSRLLDQIAKSAIDVKALHPPRHYIAQPLHIYMTLSNMRGVPYKIAFDGSGDHFMISHGDRVHYAVGGMGDWVSPSPFADNDSKREIDVRTLPSGDPTWKDFSICCLASAAFPVGLAPRFIRATLLDRTTPMEFSNEYEDRLYPIEDLVRHSTKIKPDWSADLEPNQSQYLFASSDGGIIDNDPFEYARFSLKDDLAQPINPQLSEADRAVIMVSPFPQRKPIQPEGQPAIDVVSIFKALQPALIDQARFKPSELAVAANPNVGSRYLIGPSRTPQIGAADAMQLHYPIASGLLGGFGGFVARAFRDHDFQLGRRNCQKFLSNTFAIPPDHKIFLNWPPHVQKDPRFAAPSEHMPDGRALLPRLASAADEVPPPDWPRITQVQFKTLQARIASRFVGVAPKLVEQNVNGLLRYLLKFALLQIPALNLIRDKVLAYVKLTILADLVRRDQIEGWLLGAPDAQTDFETRLVLAELINPDYNLRTVKGLMRATRLTEQKVIAALAVGESPAARGQPFEIWSTKSAGDTLYTLASRKPDWAGRISLTPFGAFLPQPTIDRPI